MADLSDVVKQFLELNKGQAKLVSSSGSLGSAAELVRIRLRSTYNSRDMASDKLQDYYFLPPHIQLLLEGKAGPGVPCVLEGSESASNSNWDGLKESRFLGENTASNYLLPRWFFGQLPLDRSVKEFDLTMHLAHPHGAPYFEGFYVHTDGGERSVNYAVHNAKIPSNINLSNGVAWLLEAARWMEAKS